MQSDRARIIAPPPLLYAAALGLILLLRRAWPLPIHHHPALGWVGVILIVWGVVLNAWGAYALVRARTALNPYRPTTAIVSTGPFRISRNPLYMGFNLVFVGLALVLNSVWGLLLAVPLLLAMHYGVIRPEERYLEAKFGNEYRRYQEDVRRYF